MYSIKPDGAACLEKFVRAWAASRDRHKFFRGLPAVVLMFITCSVRMISTVHSHKALSERYRRRLDLKLAEGEVRTAALLEQKVQQLDGFRCADVYRTAVSMDEAGATQDAMNRMQRLADEEDYLPAHLWIAHALLAGKLNTAGYANESVIQSHLDKVLESEPKNQLGLKLMAEHFAKIGDPSASISMLKHVNATDRVSARLLQLRMADLYRRDGDLFGSNVFADRVLEEVLTLGERGEVLPAESFLRLADVSTQLRNGEISVRLLQIGIKQNPGNERLTRAYRAACDQVLNYYAIRKDAEKLLQSLRLMLAYEPQEEAVHIEIAKASAMQAIQTKVEKLLEPYVVQGSLSAAVLEELGNAALLREDHATARRHFESLLERRRIRPIALNNLAWILAHHDPVDLSRALSLSELAIAEDSADRLRGTRGVILSKMGRFEEAVDDLRTALNANPSHARVYHEALSQAYERLGNQELVLSHRGRAAVARESVAGSSP